MNWTEATSNIAGKILVVGDAMVDRYIVGEVARISPEAPVPVLLAQDDSDKAGGAANVAANVAAMGGKCILMSVVGDDPGRQKLEALMAELGVAHELIVDPNHLTTQKTRLLAGRQQIARIDREKPPASAALAALREKFELLVQDVELVIFSDYGKGVLRELPEFLAIARKFGRKTLVDPKIPDPEFYRGAFMLKPNELEFRGLFGPFTEETLIDKAAAAIEKYDLGHIVLTRGPKGMLLVSSDKSVVRRPTEAIEVFDVSGAGDTVAAALALSIVAGLPVETAVAVSNIAAGIAVAHIGTYIVTRHDISQRLDKGASRTGKVLSSDELAKLISARRASGSKIAFTNGCFDILHSGHVRALASARQEADILIVALNSDASVKRLKGPSRPINCFADRAEVIAALGCVDYVTGFSEDTPYDLIRTLQPDVLIKGGDYSEHEIVGADLVKARGGRVVRVDFHQGYSSSRIIEKIASS